MTPPKPADLGRPATGLPRYYMDCGWYRHPKFRGLPVEALFLFEAGVGYSNEHNSDGRMPADTEDLSIALGIRLSVVRKGAAQLLERGVWARHDDEIVIVGYAEHNPLAVEVAEHAERQRSRGALGNHKRWHEGRGVVDPECTYCQSPGDSPEGSQKGSQNESPEGSSPGDTSPGESLGMGWDGMGIPPPSPSSNGKPSPPTSPTSPPARPAEEEDPRLQETWRQLARHDLEHRSDGADPIRDPDSWLAKAAARRRDRHQAELAAHLAEHPDAPVDQLVEACVADPQIGPAPPTTTAADLEREQTEHLAAQAEWAATARARAEQLPDELVEQLRQRAVAETPTVRRRANGMLFERAVEGRFLELVMEVS